MPSPEHESFVAELAAGGSVLTPTALPSPRALAETRAIEAAMDLTAIEDTVVTKIRLGGVDCLRLDAGGRVATPASFTCGS